LKTKLTFTLLPILFLTPIVPGGSAAASEKAYAGHYENVLGTSLEIKVIASSEAQADRAERAVLADIERENHILSSWDSSSEFSAWFRTTGCAVRVSPELFEVLDLFDLWRARTNGALDASAEVVTRVWKRAAAENRLPTQAELEATVEAVRKTHWSLDHATQSATHLSDTPLALNSFVKSYIAGRAAQAGLNASGARAIVVNIGGDLVVRGDWREPVDIADPRSDAENSAPLARVLLRDRAIATSGDYRRGVDINGRHYSHIVDPRTGAPASEVISSTVIAPSPADAGALATALSVLTPGESARLVTTVPGAEYFLVLKNGERVESAGWKALEAPPASQKAALRLTSARAAEPLQSGVWDPKFELDVTIELSLIEGFRVHRPYVAIWIENENHAPVRTIALWFGKYKYLNELRAWARTESQRSTSEDTHVMNSVSSATRPPGKYSFKWDGKDDFGNPVKAGNYTVMIEAVREHGSYQLMHEDMDFNGSPKQVQLPGGVEIALATLDYRKISQ